MFGGMIYLVCVHVSCIVFIEVSRGASIVSTAVVRKAGGLLALESVTADTTLYHVLYATHTKRTDNNNNMKNM